jgi:hypothetical protein
LVSRVLSRAFFNLDFCQNFAWEALGSRDSAHIGSLSLSAVAVPSGDAAVLNAKQPASAAGSTVVTSRAGGGGGGGAASGGSPGDASTRSQSGSRKLRTPQLPQSAVDAQTSMAALLRRLTAFFSS